MRFGYFNVFHGLYYNIDRDEEIICSHDTQGVAEYLRFKEGTVGWISSWGQVARVKMESVGGSTGENEKACYYNLK